MIVWVCVLISHMQSSQAFCMHRSYILCTAYTIYLFILLVFFLLVVAVFSCWCFGVSSFSRWLFIAFDVMCSLFSFIHISVVMWCCCCYWCRWSVGRMYICICDDELRHAVSTQQMTIRMAVRWCRCHCWCIEYLSARKEAKLNA